MNEYQTCPKCGHGNWLGPLYDPNYAPQGTTGIYRIEALVYKCVRCGYERTEEPLDKRNKTEGEGEL